MMKKETSIRLCQRLCNSHKDGNLSWHFLDCLVHGRYTGPNFAMGDALDWPIATVDRWPLFSVKLYSNVQGTYLDWL